MIIKTGDETKKHCIKISYGITETTSLKVKSFIAIKFFLRRFF